MEKLLIGLCGEKGAGKDTAAKMLHCIINYKESFLFPSYEVYKTYNFVDKERIGNIKIHHFAEPAKQVISIIFGIPIEDLNDRLKKDKLVFNLKTKIYKRKEDLFGDEFVYDINDNPAYPIFEKHYNNIMTNEYAYISIRKLLQVIGTDIFHNMFSPNVWINATLNKCKGIDIIADVRFIREDAAIDVRGGKTIKIINTNTKYKNDDKHLSEKEVCCLSPSYTIFWDGDNEEYLFNQLHEIINLIYKEKENETVC